MNPLKRIALCSVAFGSLAVALALLPTDSPIGGADGWVRGLSNAERVGIVADGGIGALPFEYRKAVLRDATPDAKVEFWQAAFKRVRSGRQLSAAQDDALRVAEQLLSTDLFGRKVQSAETLVAVGVARAQISAAFGPKIARELFVTGGPEVGGGRLPLGERIRFTWRRSQPRLLAYLATGVVPTLAAASCNCNAAADDCYYEQHCRSPFACESSTWGCGSFWMEECDKRCSYDVEL